MWQCKWGRVGVGIAEIFCSIFKGYLIITVYWKSDSRVVKIGLRDVTSIRKAVESLVTCIFLFVSWLQEDHTHCNIYVEQVMFTHFITSAFINIRKLYDIIVKNPNLCFCNNNNNLCVPLNKCRE